MEITYSEVFVTKPLTEMLILTRRNLLGKKICTITQFCNWPPGLMTSRLPNCALTTALMLTL